MSSYSKCYKKLCGTTVTPHFNNSEHKTVKRMVKSLLSLAVLCAIHTPLKADSQNFLNQNLSQDLPEQSLARSLADVAEQANMILLLPADQYQQIVSPLTNGISIKEALDTLLITHGYYYELDDDGKLTIIKSIESTNVNDPVVNIYGTAFNRYEFDEANSATGFDIDIDELPRTVQVLPEQLAQDQNANDVTDLLVNAAGVTRAHGFGGTQTQVNIRGFLNNRLFVDGNPVANRYNVDVANVESAEVILGPASVLHGQVSPGGLVNIITKKPQDIPASSLQFESDSEGKRKAVFDSTGAVTDDLAYRLILSREDSDSFREINDDTGTSSSIKDTFNISPSFRYTPNDSDTFTVNMNYAKQDLTIDRGTVALADGDGNIEIADVPVDRRFGSEFDIRESEDYRVTFDWDKEFENGWENTFNIGYYAKKFDDYQARPVGGVSSTPADFEDELSIVASGFSSASVQENGLLVRSFDSNIDVKESDLIISDSITGEYKIGDINNKLFIGANLTRREVRSGDGIALVDTPAALVAGFGFGNFINDLDIVDIFDENQTFSDIRDQTLVSDLDQTFDEFGLSIQNFAEINDRLNILTGLRYDRFDFKQDSTVYFEAVDAGGFNQLDTPEEASISSVNDNVSVQLGALYDVTDNVSFYASYSESFTPNLPDVTAGVSSVSQNFDPEEANQYEIGVKSNFFDDKLRLSVAAYEITRKNVLRFSNLEARLNGEERSRGVDISSTIQFTPGLNVLASLSLIDGEIIDDNNDNTDNEGNRLNSIPKKKARLWGSYEVQKGKYKGLGFGAGVEYVGERYGNDANTFTLPSYAVADTALWYYLPVGKNKSLKLQAGIKNLTDEEYFTANGSGNTFRINTGSPRTAYFNIRYDF